MTNPTLMNNGILVDPALSNDNAKRQSMILAITFALTFGAIAAVIAVLVALQSFTLGTSPIAVVAAFVGVAYLWIAGSKNEKLFKNKMKNTEEAVRKSIHDKYKLDLVDSVPFDNFSGLTSISSEPLRALDTATNQYVHVILHLSRDGREVTASVLTPATAH